MIKNDHVCRLKIKHCGNRGLIQALQELYLMNFDRKKALSGTPETY